MVDICITCSEASALLARLSDSCRQWRTCFQLECIENVLLHTLADIRMSLNAQRPVNCLPVEILSELFHQVLPSLHSKKITFLNSSFHLKDTNALLPLTHVCRRWRDVALDTPTLWSTLCSSFHPEAIGEYYLRSQSAPLKVFNIEKNKHLDVQQLWHTDGQRIQSLISFTGCNSDLPTSYAHGLRALAARNCVLQGNVSNLKTLILRRVDWHLPNTLINLTHLSLAKKWLHVVYLFRILSIAPRLEDLRLWAISAMEAFDAHEDVPAVTLQHLRRLAIHHPDRNIVSGLFLHVGLPANLAVNFEYCQVSDLQWLVPLTQNDAKSLYVSDDSVIVAGPLKAVRFSGKEDPEAMIQWIAALLSHFQSKDLWIASSNNRVGLDEAMIKCTPWVETLHIGSIAYLTMVATLVNNPTYWPKLTKPVTTVMS
ncbi:predicted protein [Postia placenta Mad-698-R]|nr:predicted protein [Postia placenta Mad-698-R]